MCVLCMMSSVLKAGFMLPIFVSMSFLIVSTKLFLNGLKDFFSNKLCSIEKKKDV